jgi:small subunit ribosomal protein S6
LPTQEVKRTYEAMFLIDSAVATAEMDTVNKTIDTIFERAKADVISCRKWDERRLAYPINKAKRGTYILSYFKALPEVISDLERDVRLNENILRVIVLNAEKRTDVEIQAQTPMEIAEAASDNSEEVAVVKTVDSAALVGSVKTATEVAKEVSVVVKSEAVATDEAATEVATDGEVTEATEDAAE